MVTCKTEIFAELSVDRDGQQILITAEGSSVTVHFESFRFFCREYELFADHKDFKHLLNKLNSLCKANNLFIYTKIGRSTFTAFGPKTSPFKRSILIRLFCLFGRFF